MTTLNLQPPRVALVDPKTGMITREWYRFITDSFARQGGHDAPTNNDLDVAMPEDSGVAELEMIVRTGANDQSQNPAPYYFTHTQTGFDDSAQTPPQAYQVSPEELDQSPGRINVTFDELNTAPPMIQLQIMAETIETLRADFRASADMIAVLMKQIDDLKQGLTI